MDIKNVSTLELLELINTGLKEDENISVNKLCEKLEINRNSLKSRMKLSGYSYDKQKRMYVLIREFGSNDKKNSLDPKVPGNENTKNNNINLDNDKLKLLIDNADKLIALLDKPVPITAPKNKESIVTSLRINKEVYNKIKKHATKNNANVTDIVNSALLEFLNNHK